MNLQMMHQASPVSLTSVISLHSHMDIGSTPAPTHHNRSKLKKKKKLEKAKESHNLKMWALWRSILLCWSQHFLSFLFLIYITIFLPIGNSLKKRDPQAPDSPRNFAMFQLHLTAHPHPHRFIDFSGQGRCFQVPTNWLGFPLWNKADLVARVQCNRVLHMRLYYVCFFHILYMYMCVFEQQKMLERRIN